MDTQQVLAADGRAAVAWRGWVGDTGSPNSETWLADEQPSEQGHAGKGREQQQRLRLLPCYFLSTLQVDV